VDTFAAVAERLADTHRALEIGGVRTFRYSTTYYDTLGLDAYRDHVQNRRRRYKCRSRRYDETGLCAFELKLKGARGRTIKYRMPYADALHGTLSSEAVRFLELHLLREYARGPGDGLVRSLDMSFRRLTLADLERGERLTADFGLVFASDPGGAAGRLVDGAVILESKSLRGVARADRELRALGARHVEACSKYCLGIGMTRPELPANPFRRLLGRWFVPVQGRAAPEPG
jgi:hypothetical protein